MYTVQFKRRSMETLDADRLRPAAGLAGRYPNLAAAFHHEGLPRPVQVICHAAEPQWRELNLSPLRWREQERGGGNCWPRTRPNGSSVAQRQLLR